MKKKFKRRAFVISISIILVAVGLAYAPFPGLEQKIVIVSGTELQEPLQVLAVRFQQRHPAVQLDLKFQGSQELANNYLNDRNDFVPTVLIPANGEILQELGDRWRAQNQSEPFHGTPRPVAQTLLVGIAWAERGQILFPDRQFRWQRLEQALEAGNWAALGGPGNWGSFDLAITDPTRSNSGQLSLYLWLQAHLGGSPPTPATLNTPSVQSLLGLIKRSVYQPPRSTDILLQEFITRGANDADVALVYESIALYRWQQAATTQGQPYQVYYLNPTIPTTSTAAIVRRQISDRQVQAAQTFLDFLTQPEQQAVFVQYGFRPVTPGVDVQTVPNSPWRQNIPGAQTQLDPAPVSPPEASVLTEIQRLWERAQ